VFKRIFLFIAVNILVVLTISITLSLFGVGNYLSANGIDYQALLAFCAIVGFTGAFVSLATSRMMAKFAMGVKVIDPNGPKSAAERELLTTVHRLAKKAHLPAMPQVGYYVSPEVNAFATGPTKARALVAVSTGLLERMDNRAVEGVLGHEVAHIANGDMVTMTLLQGVVNTFVMFFARIAAWTLSQALSGDRDREDRAPNYFLQSMLVFVFEIAFSLLGAVVVAWFSRQREFRADAGGATLASRDQMIHALRALKGTQETVDDGHPSLASFKINGRARGLAALFSTHPDLDVRIAALQAASGAELRAVAPQF
jgi:heat shock protein HtpX